MERNSLEVREFSDSRGDGRDVPSTAAETALPDVAVAPNVPNPIGDAPIPDAPAEPSDVKTLLAPDEPVAPPDVATVVAPDDAPDVKTLVAPDSPAAEMTGAVAPERHRRRLLATTRLRQAHRTRVKVHVRAFDSFRHPGYAFLWLATVFTSAGFWLQQVVVGWLAYRITESAFWTSLALGLDALPILLVGPIGGLLVDNFDRRKLLAAVCCYQAVVTSVFAVIVMTGALQAWHIFAFIFFMGISWVISDPARMSLVANIVPRENLVNAFALNSMAFSATRLALPAAGGLLIAFAGPGPTLAIEAALQACAVVVALRLPSVQSSKAALRIGTALGELRDGARYALGQPTLIGMFALTALPALLVMPSIQGLMPVYAAEVFGVDSRGLGLMLSAIGAGSTLGAFALASFGELRAKNAVALGALVILALTMATFSVNPLFGAAYLNLMMLSAAMMAFFSVSNAVIQSAVSDEYRGRVTGLYMLTWGLFPFGSLVSGFLAERLGAPHATQIAAGMMAALLALAVWRIKALRNLDAEA